MNIVQAVLFDWLKIPSHLQPDFEDFHRDPQEFLANRIIQLGTMRIWPLYIVISVSFGLAGWGGWLKGLHVAWIPVMFTLGLVGVAAMHWTIRGTLIIDRNGVSKVVGRRKLFIPWSTISQFDDPSVDGVMKLVIPINQAALASIVLFRGENVVASGSEIKADAFDVQGDSTVTMICAFEVPPAEIAALIESGVKQPE